MSEVSTEMPPQAAMDKPTPGKPSIKSALEARMARFKALQASKMKSAEANHDAALAEVKNQAKAKNPDQVAKLQKAQAKALVNMVKEEEGANFERKRGWDYTAEEDEKWNDRKKMKAANTANNAFGTYSDHAAKVYESQIERLSKTTDISKDVADKAALLQRQVASGVLSLVETDGDIFTIDKEGRINTPVEENYNCDHKPSKEAIDRLVDDLEKGERARLKARAARGIKDKDDSGDVTYINAKNKQFNDKLARFYNKYTTEIRENFERGTAI